MQDDIANMKAAIAAAKPTEGFINTASPGTIALFQPNDFYPTQDAYLEAVAEGMRAEYEGLTQAGPADPDRRAGHGHGPAHHVPRPHRGRFRRPRRAPRRSAEPRAAQCARPTGCACMCAGATTKGPHTHDVPLEKLLPVVMKAKPQAILFEAANPRHAHEWKVFRDAEIHGAGRQDPGARRAQHDDQLCRASRAGGRAAGEASRTSWGASACLRARIAASAPSPASGRSIRTSCG